MKELAIGNTVYSLFFFKEISSHGSFHVPENCQHDLLYRRLSPEHFLYGRVSVSTSWTVFLTTHRGKPMFNPFVNIFLTKTGFSVNITHCSVNFIWFALFNHQKFHDRPQFKPGAVFNLLPFWIASKQILL